MFHKKDMNDEYWTKTSTEIDIPEIYISQLNHTILVIFGERLLICDDQPKSFCKTTPRYFKISLLILILGNSTYLLLSIIKNESWVIQQ